MALVAASRDQCWRLALHDLPHFLQKFTVVALVAALRDQCRSRDAFRYTVFMSTHPPRKTMRRYEVEGDIRYLTCSTHRRVRIFESADGWVLFGQRPAGVRVGSGVRLYAWVLMPDHFHLLLCPDIGRSQVSEILHALKRPVAEAILRTGLAMRRPDAPTRIWEPGGRFDRNIRNTSELYQKAKYIELNPVRAELVKSAADWPWSSAHARRGDASTMVLVESMPR
mgnify:CR=1 FL=1